MNKIQNAEQPFLTLQHLEKVYPNGEKAVYDFNLDVKKKEFIVIVGPSGCGKSTTLRMIAGLEDITSGDIFLEGELLNYRPSKDRKMAIVFQSYALYPQMNVFDNIAFPLTINTYPAPMTDKELYPLGELRSVLNDTAPEALFNILSSAFAARLKKKALSEKLATAFRISPEAAAVLAEMYRQYAAGEQQKSDARQESARQAPDADKAETVKQWLAVTNEKIAALTARLEEEGVRVNERFEILDENGKVKTEYRKFTPYEIRTRVYDTAAILDLKPYLDKLPKELSGGQMQRVALGRAIIKNVPIFMMDEPLSNLDAKLRLTMRSEIVKLHNRIDATTIYVTHDQTEAMTMATRIVVMSRGFIQQIGTPEEVYSSPANVFVARFIGSPTMNIFDAQFDRATGELSFGGIKVALGREFTARHDAFYRRKAEELRGLLEGFDSAAREKILKLLSATGESSAEASSSARKSGLRARIKSMLGKRKEAEGPAPEEQVCRTKLERLEECLSDNHTVTVGIRPERIGIEKKRSVRKSAGTFTVKPTVCELLGGEYNVHFDFCGKDMVGRFDARHKISAADEITVSFSPEDLYLFDPITGDVIE